MTSHDDRHDVEDAADDRVDGTDTPGDDNPSTDTPSDETSASAGAKDETAVQEASETGGWPAPQTSAPPSETPASPDLPHPSAESTDATASTDGDRATRWPLVAALVVAVLASAYVAGWYLAGERLAASTTIAGVDVGGLSPSAAEQRLRDELGPRRGQPVALVFEDQDFSVDPDSAGMSLDVEASVAAAGGERSWDPRDIAGLFTGGRDHDAVLSIDREAFEDSLNKVVEAVSIPVTEAQISFPEGTATPREPEPGRSVPLPRLADVVEGAYLVADEPVTVPTEVVQPQVDSAALATAMTEVAEPAIGEPVVLRIGDRDVDLPPTAWIPALTIEPVDGVMTPVLDATALAEPLTDNSTGIGTKAVDAEVDIRDGRVVIIDGRPGVGLLPEEMAERLPPVLTASGPERSLQIDAKPVDPTFTTADAEAMRITERVSSFDTRFPHSADNYRNINQGRAAELLDGVIVEPGETFSFNDTVGERTEANGFTGGTVIAGGRFKQELGGGVSQVVTTLYNAAFFAGLDDVEHHPHLFYLDRYPIGREATVYWGSLDLRFRNSTDYGVLIKASVDPSAPGRDGTMRVEMWSTKVWDVEAGKSDIRNRRSPSTRYDSSPECVPQSPIAGFDIDIYRVLKRDGEVVKRETDTARYEPADRIICGADPNRRGDANDGG